MFPVQCAGELLFLPRNSRLREIDEDILVRLAQPRPRFDRCRVLRRRAKTSNLRPLPKNISDKLLEKNPELATSLGEHRYDDRLSDYSQAGIQAQVQFQRQSSERLGQIETSKLSAVNRIDFGILQSQIQSALFQLENLREHEWNPLFYNVGNAIYGLTAREFAPLKDRLEECQGTTQSHTSGAGSRPD